MILHSLYEQLHAIGHAAERQGYGAPCPVHFVCQIGRDGADGQQVFSGVGQNATYTAANGQTLTFTKGIITSITGTAAGGVSGTYDTIDNKRLSFGGSGLYTGQSITPGKTAVAGFSGQVNVGHWEAGKYIQLYFTNGIFTGSFVVGFLDDPSKKPVDVMQ